MKKLLNLLSISIFLTSSCIVPKLVSTQTVENQQDRKLQLRVSPIEAEKNGYCTPACVQMILRYFQIDLTNYSQDQIYNALGGRDNGGGTDPYADIARYLNEAIPEGTFRRDYGEAWIPYQFGDTQDEQALFQYYVYQSLYMGHPVLFSHNQSATDAHSMLITGIITNGNPTDAQYFVSDVGGEDSYWVFNGSDLVRLFFQYGPGRLIGYQNNRNFEKHKSLMALDNYKIDKIGLTDYENHEVIRAHMDLTAAMGITKPYNLQQSYSELRLDHFNGGIYTFNGGKSVKDFSVPITGISENDLDTQTPLVTIDSASETVGWAHIEGKILAQLEFRITALSHIVAQLVIYIQATSAWTDTNSHVWFETGDVLSFIKK